MASSPHGLPRMVHTSAVPPPARMPAMAPSVFMRFENHANRYGMTSAAAQMDITTSISSIMP